MAARTAIPKLTATAAAILFLFSIANAAPANRSISSGAFIIHFPQSLSSADVEKAATALSSSKKKLARIFGSPDNSRVHVQLYASTGDFCSATGHPWWHGAVALKGKLHLQPPSTLAKKGILESTTTHELAHFRMQRIAGHSLPAWFEEGFATLTSGEFDNEFKSHPQRFFLRETPQGLNALLDGKSGREQSAGAYRAAFALAQYAKKRFGMKKLIAIIEETSVSDFGKAFKKITGRAEADFFKDFQKQKTGKIIEK